MAFQHLPVDLEDVGDARWVIVGIENFIWPLLILVFITFSLLLPESFFTRRNLQFLLFSSAAIGALALAEGLCLLSGHFDLSIGAVSGFSAMFAAKWMADWFPNTPGIVGIAVVIGIGAAIGLANGFSVGILGVNPFLQTLGFLIIFDNATQVISHTAVVDMPDSYKYLGGGSLYGDVPVAIPLIVALFVVAWLCLKYTATGLSIYAVGGNKQSALQAGINTRHVIILVYTLSGALCGLAGMLYTGYIGSVTPNLTDGTLFVAFAATVIGGISLFGGRGNILGALGGVILLAMIQAGLVMMEIPSELVQTINGVILLMTILIYTGEERLRNLVLAS